MKVKQFWQNHTVSFIQGWHYPNNLTRTATVSQHADESVDTASHYTISITSAGSYTNSSEEMARGSLKKPATTCTASGISTNGGIANGSLENHNSTWYWL